MTINGVTDTAQLYPMNHQAPARSANERPVRETRERDRVEAVEPADNRMEVASEIRDMSLEAIMNEAAERALIAETAAMTGVGQNIDLRA